MSRSRLTGVLIGLTVAIGCAPSEPESAPEAPSTAVDKEGAAALSVFTVHYPLQYFAERLGGDLVEVTFPAPAGEDPAYWSPGPETVADYQSADLILLNGVGYAKWLARATLPAGKLVDTAAGFEDRWIPLEAGPVHSHGLEGEHSHQGYAFTTWLDPQLAIEQARAVATALTGALPEHEARIRSSLGALEADLRALDSDLDSVALAIDGRPVLFSHPVYQYLAARYGLNSRAVHWEPGEAPSQEQWQELESIVAGHSAQWMIWEADPAAATEERLQTLGIQSVVYAPCAHRPTAGDWLSVMRGNVAALRSIGGSK